MVRAIKYLLITLSVAVYSQNTATVQYQLKQSCYKFSIVRLLETGENDCLITEKLNYPKEGKFEIKTDDKFPLPYSFLCENEDRFVKASRLFTVASGDKLKFNMDSIVNDKQYFSDTDSQTPLWKDQHDFYKAFPDTVNLFSENDKTYRANLTQFLPSFEKYAKEHPNSPTLFWNLVHFFEENFYYTGYHESYLNAFNSLSPSIRNSKYGKISYQKIMISSKIQEGLALPNIQLAGGKNFRLGKKYTLVDFWASFCQPCLEVFPIYKELYEVYKNKGFELVGISGDRQRDLYKSKKIIQDRQLNWQQYNDIGGKEFEKYNITGYPTTFLLDSEGIILKINISAADLEVFLKENLTDI